MIHMTYDIENHIICSIYHKNGKMSYLRNLNSPSRRIVSSLTFTDEFCKTIYLKAWQTLFETGRREKWNGFDRPVDKYRKKNGIAYKTDWYFSSQNQWLRYGIKESFYFFILFWTQMYIWSLTYRMLHTI